MDVYVQRNIVFVGDSCAGKSNLINYLVGKDVCQTDDSPLPCTYQAERIIILKGDKVFHYYDTPGLSEFNKGIVGLRQEQFLMLLKYYVSYLTSVVIVIKYHEYPDQVLKSTEAYLNLLNIKNAGKVTLVVFTHVPGKTQESKDKNMDVLLQHEGFISLIKKFRLNTENFFAINCQENDVSLSLLTTINKRIENMVENHCVRDIFPELYDSEILYNENWLGFNNRVKEGIDVVHSEQKKDNGVISVTITEINLKLQGFEKQLSEITSNLNDLSLRIKACENSVSTVALRVNSLIKQHNDQFIQKAYFHNDIICSRSGTIGYVPEI